jgi:hypothetical protein
LQYDIVVCRATSREVGPSVGVGLDGGGVGAYVTGGVPRAGQGPVGCGVAVGMGLGLMHRHGFTAGLAEGTGMPSAVQ